MSSLRSVACLVEACGDFGLTVQGDDRSWQALSPCGRYRYALGRSWQDPLFPRPTMLFVLHNPSTADHADDDPTLRRCIGFAKREDCGGLVIVNVMAWRATEKRDLLTVSDVEGPSNAVVWFAAFACADRVIFGWGKIDPKLKPHLPISERAMCLGTTEDGSPRHPLFLASDTPLVRYP